MRVNLSLAATYVPDWTYLEAIREICQNAMDQFTKNPNNRWSVQYDETIHVLRIKSHGAYLDRSTLLLGSTTKANDPSTIGKFGEGYKLAMLVLCRLGHEILIWNFGRGNKEVWIPSIKFARTYKTDVLGFDINKALIESPPDNDLTFAIGGISPQQWSLIQGFNLRLGVYPAHIRTDKGYILLASNYRGHIFINGLFVEVSKDSKMVYGYDIKPEHLQLDRDRHMVREVDLFFLTSQMWIDSQDMERIQPMLEDGSSDIKYFEYSHSGPKKTVAEGVRKVFISRHGEYAVPVTSQWEADDVKENIPNGKPVIVSDAYKHMIYHSAYTPPSRAPRQTPYQIIDNLENLEHSREYLLEQANNWTWR